MTSQFSDSTKTVTVRKVTIDQAKAVGIVAVVLGHSIPSDSRLAWAICSFHMPLFFLLSGLLLREDKVREPWRATLERVVRTLFIPYLFFAAMSIALNMAFRPRSYSRNTSSAMGQLLDGISAVIYGAGERISDANHTIWFFTALAVTICYYRLLRMCINRRWAVAVSLVLSIAVIQARRNWSELHAFLDRNGGTLPWNLDVSVCCLFFYSLGAALSNIEIDRGIQWSRMMSLTIGMALLATGIWMAFGNTERVDLKLLITGHESIFFPVRCWESLASSCCLACCRRIPSLDTWDKTQLPSSHCTCSYSTCSGEP